jgi:hypothetical protein
MPKITNTGLPDEKWTLEKLAAYAKTSLGTIQRAGRLTAVETYRVGRALYFAQLKLVRDRKWNEWLDEQNISPVTAWEAIALYEAVKDEDDTGAVLENMGITEAKEKYGIYKSADKRAEGYGNIREMKDLTGEEKVTASYHRLDYAATALASIDDWDASLLYSTEVNECLRFCGEIVKTITTMRKKIKEKKGT